MKKFLFHILIVFVVVLSVNPLMAEESFLNGRIFTIGGDTLVGWIKIQDNAAYASGCIFRSTAKGQSQKLWLKDLTGFELDNGKRCFNKRTVMHLFYPREVFLETLIKGKLDFYYWKDYGVGDVMYLSRQGDSLLVPLPFRRFKGNYGEWYVPMQNEVLSTEHQDSLYKYMEDKPELLEDIIAIKIPTVANVSRLIMKYNGITDTMAVLGKTKPMVKLGRCFVTPGVTISGYKPLHFDSWDYYLGATFSYRIVGNNDLFTANAGCYKRLKERGGPLSPTSYQYKVPMYLEYRFMAKWFRPFFCFGVDLFKNERKSRFLLAPAVGFSLKLADKVDFNLRYISDMDITIFDFRHEIISYDGLVAGVQLQLF